MVPLWSRHHLNAFLVYKRNRCYSSRMDDETETTFLHLLFADVARVVARTDNANSHADRRDLVRTSFAAIEGLVWVLKQRFSKTAQETYGLDAPEIAVLADKSFRLGTDGKIHSQQNHLPTLATIRLISRIAERISGQASIDFSLAGWEQLRLAIQVRNRITHPKKPDDLQISASDLATVLDSTFWLLDQAANLLEAEKNIHQTFLEDFDEALQLLKKNDPETVALYRALQNADE